MFGLVCIILKLVNNISRIINSGIFYSYTILTMKDPYKEYFINQTHSISRHNCLTNPLDDQDG